MLDLQGYIPVWVALVAALPGIVSAVLGFVLRVRQVENHAETQTKLNAIEASTNGKLTSVENKLALVTEAAELAKSVLAEKNRQEREG